jgi:hypothetical protein
MPIYTDCAYHERIEVMTRIKHAEVGLFVFTVTASGVAVAANCPNTLPVQLLEDCIQYENSGRSFPADDYVYMDQYQDWLRTQQAKAQSESQIQTEDASKINN